jgi:predicted DNA-binding antitoxin AbrB/MazE fold protein
MTIHAIYENGVFRPLEPVNLPEKCQVEIERIQVIDPANSGNEPPLMRLARIAEQLPGDPNRPTDMAAQHDHYLYGTPKRP